MIIEKWNRSIFSFLFYASIYLVLPIYQCCCFFALAFGFMFQLNSCESHSQKHTSSHFKLSIYAQKKQNENKMRYFFSSREQPKCVLLLNGWCMLDTTIHKIQTGFINLLIHLPRQLHSFNLNIFSKILADFFLLYLLSHPKLGPLCNIVRTKNNKRWDNKII